MSGFSYNPTALQMRSALKKLLLHVGTKVLDAANGNCTPQDETTLLSLSPINFDSKVVIKLFTKCIKYI